MNEHETKRIAEALRRLAGDLDAKIAWHVASGSKEEFQPFVAALAGLATEIDSTAPAEREVLGRGALVLSRRAFWDSRSNVGFTACDCGERLEYATSEEYAALVAEHAPHNESDAKTLTLPWQPPSPK